MMRLAALFFALTVSSVFAQSEQLPGNKWAYYGEQFYRTLPGTAKIEKDTLHEILNGMHVKSSGKFDTISEECTKGSCYKHEFVSYDQARKIMFGELDTLKDSEGTYILDVYCGKKFYFSNVSEVGNMHTEVNIEHTWPQSRFTNGYPKGMQKSDMHHLYLTDSKANSVRGNNPFGLRRGQEEGGEGCHAYYSYLVDMGSTYTPPAPHRGNVARSLFYFSVRYQIKIDPTQEAFLRQWHKADPVDAKEIKRHAGIVNYQKVRNPFVDHPELVDRISDF